MNTEVVYECPDCKMHCRSVGKHQHANGEWIEHTWLAALYTIRRWGAILDAQLPHPVNPVLDEPQSANAAKGLAVSTPEKSADA